MGCGKHREPGWTNADASPDGDLTIILDETTVLPIGDSTLDVVFSEHFIEHVSFRVAANFFSESQRVLRKGGLFRCSTPDLDWLLSNAQSTEWTRLRDVYREIGDFPASANWELGEVVNWAFRGHGHQFLWNQSVLERELVTAGFVQIRRMPFGASSVQDAAIEIREGEAFYSLIVEARKP